MFMEPVSPRATPHSGNEAPGRPAAGGGQDAGLAEADAGVSSRPSASRLAGSAFTTGSAGFEVGSMLFDASDSDTDGEADLSVDPASGGAHWTRDAPDRTTGSASPQRSDATAAHRDGRDISAGE